MANEDGQQVCIYVMIFQSHMHGGSEGKDKSKGLGLNPRCPHGGERSNMHQFSQPSPDLYKCAIAQVYTHSKCFKSSASFVIP